jgi:alanine racemase
MDGHPEALIDLGAINDNVSALARHVGGAQVMAVVKSDGYGHGMIPAAAAALAGGATWLGVVHVAEAVTLRQAGVTVPVLCLLAAPDAPHEEAIRHDVDLSAGSADLVRQIAAAAGRAGRPARLHLKADTGMSRGGATAADWPGLVEAALAAQAAGQARITGIWSHLACADIPGHPSTGAQLTAFLDALEVAERAGARPEVRHLANTAAALNLPETWFDLVRPGGGIYGLATLPGGAPGWLRPAMTVRTMLVQVKRVPPGAGVSYGHRYVTAGDTTLGLVPLGYAEGIPRQATNTGQVQVRGQRWTISGTVCMNQLVVDFGDEPVAPGDEVTLFGPGDAGEPTAQEWADALGTISYDIVTRFSGRMPRSYSGVTQTMHPMLAETAGGLAPPGEAATAAAGPASVPLVPGDAAAGAAASGRAIPGQADAGAAEAVAGPAIPGKKVAGAAGAAGARNAVQET